MAACRSAQKTDPPMFRVLLWTSPVASTWTRACHITDTQQIAAEQIMSDEGQAPSLREEVEPELVCEK
jgi:hypothetical protein